MDKKSYKYRFIKKNSPKSEKNKTLEKHYSKIICSIFDKNKEKKKEEEKIIDKEKKEKDIIKIYFLHQAIQLQIITKIMKVF